MKKKIAIDVLSRLVKFLNDYKIPFHLSGGTLMGCIRENDIIDGDTDLDLCSYVPYIPIIYSLKDKLKEYDLYLSREQKGDNLLKSWKKKHCETVYGVKVNYPNQTKYLWRLSFNGTNKDEGIDDHPEEFRWIDIYGQHWFPMTNKVMFNNIEVNIPMNSDKYLDIVYGNWKKPVHRKVFKRPMSAEPIYECTTLYFSKYGVNNRDNTFKYLDEKECEDFVDIKEFTNKYDFIGLCVKPTLDLVKPS